MKLLLISSIETLIKLAGRLSALLIILLVFLITYDVAMRYFFQNGSIALQELEWHLFALIFLFGTADTLRHDKHVRVDLLYRSQKLGEHQRAWINLLGAIFLLIPFCLMILINTWPFVSNSLAIYETSPDPGGLPYRWLLKASILFGVGLLLLQGIAEILKSIDRLED